MASISRWIDERIDLKTLRAQPDRSQDARRSHLVAHPRQRHADGVLRAGRDRRIMLAMYYSPSPDHAYDSIRFIEHNVLSGALLRGIHHWGASAMVVLVVAHMIRVFSMGSYKYPREMNWLLGVGLLFIVLGFSFTGYLLPWDQKAYWATQVGTNIAGTHR